MNLKKAGCPETFFRVAFRRERGYTYPCRVRDEDWVPCDLSV